MYMPFTHDHDKWLADKKIWQQKAKKQKKSDSDKSKDNNEDEMSKSDTKKAKSFCVTEPQAQQFIDKLYGDIDGDQAKD